MGLSTDDARPAALAARDVHFSRRGARSHPFGPRALRPVLLGASIALRRGEVLALLGANGAGKSTLLRVLLGLLPPAGGEVLLEGRALGNWSRRDIARRMAYVPQQHAPPFPYTVRDVAALGRLPHHGMAHAAGARDGEQVAAVLAQLGLAALADRPYTEVSGGERQLALIARALVQGAAILVCDEPANGLDWGHQQRLMARLRALAEEEGRAVLFTTHHPDHAREAADRVALLRAGRIVAEGAPGETLTRAALADLYGLRSS